MVRETFGAYASFLLGFTTYSGGLHAASDWGRPGQTFQLRPPLDNSWEAAFHAQIMRLRDECGDDSIAGLYWPCGETRSACPDDVLFHRLVGVVYRPESER